MKVTYNWLKNFTDIKISPKKLADKLTMAGLEVTSLEPKNGDFVFEIEVTSNRPDWLNIIGLAREVAAITGAKLKLPQIIGRRPSAVGTEPLKIIIENKKDCPVYTAKIIRGVKIAPSPDWLKKRLELIACRSINNIVDITNYIMFEWGEPLHAFDLAKLADNTIIVRRGKNGEKITTIDGEVRLLSPGILVIADAKTPIAVAGVMGGKDSEVCQDTRDILLEAAVFEPALIRRGRQSLGLQSESSYRFERGINMAVVEAASLRAVQLIQDICGGTLAVSKKSGATKVKSKKVDLNAGFVERILGVSLKPAQIRNILTGLDFKVKAKAKNNLSVEIPDHRQDVACAIDLVEEIARIFGFENIPSSFPEIAPLISVAGDYDFVAQLKDMLLGLGLQEAITYSFWDKGLLGISAVSQNQAIEIINPLNCEQETLRNSLWPSLAACLAYNLNQKQDQVGIFEIAKTYYFIDGNTHEELSLGVALCGVREIWSEQGCLKNPVGMLHLKGILETVLRRLGINNYRLKNGQDLARFEVYSQEKKLGQIFKAPKNVLEKLGIKNKDVFLLELNLGLLRPGTNLDKKYVPWPAYPGISRDISLIISEETRADETLKIIQERCGGILEEIKAIDYYQGQQIPKGFKGLTVSCFYRSRERTLTEDEISPLHSQVLDLLTKEFGAQIR